MPEPRVPGFTDLTLVAAGSTATTYRATRLATGSPVALKVLRLGAPEEVVFRARFAREVSILKAVSSAGVVRLEDAGVDPRGAPYLATAWVDGRTLDDRLAAGGPVTPGEAVAISCALLAALADLHDAGVCHRDVQPANVLLADDGRVLLADLGVAILAGALVEGYEAAGLTPPGRVMGTEAYASPEQLRGEHSRSPDHDVYAAAVILREMLGLPPQDFGRGDAGPGSPRLRSALGDVLRRALDPIPARRMRSARSLRLALLGLAEAGL